MSKSLCRDFSDDEIWPKRSRRLGGRVAVIVCLALLGSPAGADLPGELSVSEGSSSPSADEDASPLPPPDIGLDALLKLPSSWSGSEETRQGLTSFQWRARFAALALERQETEDSVSRARRELDGMAEEGGSGSWQMGAPGSNNTEVSPMSFKHRELIRSGKQRLDELRRRKRALDIEADIAGVPESWRAPERAPAP